MKLRGLALAFAVLALAACNNEETRNLIDLRSGEAKEGLRAAKDPAPKKTYNPLRVTEKVWAGSASMRLRRGQPLPPRFEGQRGITFVSADGMTLADIANAISAQIGIPVRLGAGVSAPMGPLGGGSKAEAAAAAAAAAGGMQISYEGPLSALLDHIAGHYGINWRYDGSSINFTRYETRVFMIEALPGVQTVKDGMKEDENSGSSSSSSSSGGASFSASNTSSLEQSSSMSLEIKFWEELANTLNAMISGQGTVVVSPSTGAVTVTTTPEQMRIVARYIEQENKRLSQQIAINVEIYSVALSDGTDFSVSFNTALRRLADFGANFAGAVGPTATSSAMGSAIAAGQSTGLDVTGGMVTGGGNLAVAILNPEKAGQISSMFSALSTIGDTTRVAQFPMTTLNNKPVSRRIGRDRTYIASVSNSTSQSFSTNSVTPGTIREGFSLQLTPRMLDDGRIMLQYSLSLIDIVKVESITVGTDSQIQLPETSSRVFVQQAMLKSGSTLIIGGFDDEQAAQSSQGVGNAFNYLFGGGSSNATSHTMLFIAITPQMLDVPHREQDE